VSRDPANWKGVRREEPTAPGRPAVPAPIHLAVSAMVAAPDHLAAEAGRDLFARGGSAADAAIAASAVLAVTFQHACGLGGDLWALVVGERGEDATGAGDAAGVRAVDAAGRAGSGANPDRLRAAGHRAIPPRGHVAAVPVPGCVDGWLALHATYGRRPLAEVLAPATHYARDGFPASPGLVAGLAQVRDVPAAADYLRDGWPDVGHRIRRPGVARALEAIASDGRAGFYGGEFGEELLRLGAGEYTPDDLAEPLARVRPALSLDAFGRRLWTAPPTSQGYLTLAAAWLADGLLGSDPEDPAFVHVLVEASRQAAYDRPEVLFDGADGAGLLAAERLRPRRGAIDPNRASAVGGHFADGGTVAVVAVGPDGDAVSLLQSNAAGFGSGLGLSGLGIFLQNRGIGFSLEPGHPAEYGPGRRPPHTLSPLLVTDEDGDVEVALATMGGDTQPQTLLQLLARLLVAGETPTAAMAAPRFRLTTAAASGVRPSGFDTWAAGGQVIVELEGHAPSAWDVGLRARGHQVRTTEAFSGAFGHAQLVQRAVDHLAGASDPRSATGGIAAL